MMITSTPSSLSRLFSDEEEEYEDEIAMMRAVLADAMPVEEHVLNYKCSIKGHRVLNQIRAWGI